MRYASLKPSQATEGRAGGTEPPDRPVFMPKGETGGDRNRRWQEAAALLRIIGDEQDDRPCLTDKDRAFLRTSRARLASGPERHEFTPPMIFWLRDLRDKLL